jgi:hypothetical protein
MTIEDEKCEDCGGPLDENGECIALRAYLHESLPPGSPLARVKVEQAAVDRAEALRHLLYWCLDAQANGHPLPVALDRAIRNAENLVDISDLLQDPPPCEP